jgi:phage tail sheath protein FI
MPFQLSPGVAVVEKDFTSIVPAVATSIGAFAGQFDWGPVLEPITITSEDELVRRFGTPNTNNFQSFFTAANFLSYSNNLLLVRQQTTNMKNAVVTPTGAVTSVDVVQSGTGYDSLSSPPSVQILTEGLLDTVTVTNQGTGYVNSGMTFPTVTVNDPTGVGAVLEANISGGRITSIDIIAPGAGYTNPTITITGGNGTGAAATVTAKDVQEPGGVAPAAVAVLSGGAITAVNLSSGGSGYTSVPNVSVVTANGDAGTGATATAVLSGSGVTGITVGNSGTNYTSPTVSFTGGGGSGAQATAVLSGAVSSITLISAGSGYSSNPSVTITGGGGSGATATATTDGNAITSISIVSGGAGYTSEPTVTITGGGGSGGVADSIVDYSLIASINVTSAGVGYTTAPTIVISDATGSGATATAAIGTSSIASINIANGGSGYKKTPTVTITGGGGSGAAVGSVTVGSSSVIGVTVTEGGTGLSSAPAIIIEDANSENGITAVATANIATAGVAILNGQFYSANFINGGGVVGEWAAKYPGKLGNSLKVSMADRDTYSTWAYKDEFDSAPGTSEGAAIIGGSNDEMHIIVIDEKGYISGVENAVLEKYAFVSKASDNKKTDGTNNYYKDVINGRSEWLWWTDHTDLVAGGYEATNWGVPMAGTAFKSMTAPLTQSLSGGVDDNSSTDGQKMAAYELFANATLYDINLIMMGKANSTVTNFVIDNVALSRLDAVVFISPEDPDSGEVIIGDGATHVNKIIDFRNELGSNSYSVMDSGYKYQYDRYNDVYRWVPLNGDIAGLCARTDYTNDPWWSPGGLNRGQIKNVVRLSCNPNQTMRDNLYRNSINPVVTFPGQGTVLFGDKTLLTKPSAFDRINVRRLFIVLEKSIATAAKYQLFEFNDAFTRGQFRNLIEPFLRDVQGRRGITDFLVKCDESNNSGEVIDRNEFVADIFVKPTRSINFITLNFVAARSSIAFSEIGG